MLDLKHLARQCMGDAELEAEVLGQFRTQAVTLAANLADDDRLSLAAKADIAHRLRGSALAIGAGSVARAAGLVESCGRAGAKGGPEAAARVAELSQAVADLGEAVKRAAAEIDRLHR
jgi:HPt (histidine-containing phosphotransfer) domain-containing protein